MAAISLRTISACLPTTALWSGAHTISFYHEKSPKNKNQLTLNVYSERHLEHQKEMLRSRAYTILRNETRRNEAKYN